MFSQNVVDPREFITEPGESVWDSQQNSQVWNYSQNSNSQIGQFVNSQGNTRNNGSARSLNTSGGSDYWSQSQNVSQTVQENEDDARYHLKYLNKPALFSSNNSKPNEEKQQIKTFHQYVELQRNKSVEQEQRSKLDSISKFLQENSEETRSSIGALKSELASEFATISENILTKAKESTSHIEKLTGDIKQSIDVAKDDALHKHQKASEEVIKLQSQLSMKEKEIEHLRQQMNEAHEREKMLTTKENTHMSTSEEIMQKILAAVTTQAVTADVAMQTDSQQTRENATQCLVPECSVQETQTEMNHHLDASPRSNDQFPNANQPTAFNPAIVNDSFQNSMFYTGRHMMGNAQYSNTGTTHNAVESCVGNIMTYSALPQAAISAPLQQSKGTVETKPLSHFAVPHRIQPLSHYSPSQRPIAIANSLQQPSPVATVAPLVQEDQVKQEDKHFTGDCLYNVKRPRSRRTPSNNKKEDPSSIFLFELCSDSEESQESCQLEKSPPDNLPNYQAEQCTDLLTTGGVSHSPTAVVKKNTIQKSITTYGKIKKSNIGEMSKENRGTSPKTSNSSIRSNVATKPKMKSKTRVTSRGSVAQMRKEYAESAFAFNDDVHMKDIQFAFKKRGDNIKRKPDIC